MINTTELIWDNQEDKLVFEAAGLSHFDDFWKIEDNNKFELQVRRQHITDAGDIERQTVRIPFNGKDYYLKRTSASAYRCIKNEYEALAYVPLFGFVPPQSAVHAFDENTQRGFVLLKNMDGFYCLGDIRLKKLPEDILALIGDVTPYYPSIISKFKAFQKSQFFYRDWMDKHIFINPETKDIGLIDLERFLPKSEVPFHWRLPFVYGYKRKKERIKLMKALSLTSL